MIWMRTARTSWTKSFDAALSWLYPQQCALCSRIGMSSVCEECASEMQPLATFQDEAADAVLSFRLSAFSYDGRAAQAVRRLKYSRATALGSFMSAAVYDIADKSAVVDGRMVVPVPIHWTRRCARGFNQAELLCERFPKQLIHRRLLIRAKATAPQASLKAEQRRVNLVDAFRVSESVKGQQILLVDDVVTTGHTARECARVLMDAGAIDVGLLTFAAEL